MKHNISIGLVIGVALCTALLAGRPFMRDLEFKLYDLASMSCLHLEQSDDIVLIGIDDTSLHRLGRWPWPRDYFATLLNLLYYFKPAATGLDILFTEPDTQNTHNDTALGQLAESIGSVCFGYYFRFTTTGALHTGTDSYSAMEDHRITRIHGDTSALIDARTVTLPVAPLRQTMGYLNVPRGTEAKGETSANLDGVIRDVPLVIRYGNGVYPSFALQLVRVYLGLSYDDIEVIPGEAIVLHRPAGSPVKIPVDRSCRMMVRYTGGVVNFKTISFEDTVRAANYLAQQKQPPFDPASFFGGKLVVVGLTATGMDVGQLPLPEKLSPLCLVHLNAIRTILEEKFIYRLPLHTSIAIAVALTVCMGAVAIFGPPVVGMVLFIALISVLMWGYCYLLQQGTWFPAVPSIFGTLAAFVSVTASNLIREEHEKRMIKKMFGHYVSPNVLEDILKNKSNLALGGEKRDLTVLFSDIRSFTTYCESRTPEEVVSILNEYLDAMTEVILDNGGTLDKYVGDEIMAIFGAPGSANTEHHPYMAVKTASAMIDRLRQLHEKWAAEGREPFEIGIGINTGIMKVGNMGSKRLFDYTVIGDEVNVGARIESLTRTYNVPIIISENTYNRVRDYVACTQLGSTMVKGKKNPVTIYSVEKVTGNPIASKFLKKDTK